MTRNDNSSLQKIYICRNAGGQKPSNQASDDLFALPNCKKSAPNFGTGEFPIQEVRMIFKSKSVMAISLGAILSVAPLLGAAPSANAQGKPNILVIWGDDIGLSNISAYTRGLVG
jgi:hypothetical protein